MAYLGIDIGTSAVKAVLIDAEQQYISQASIPLTVSRPQELWSEQNPDDWWQATCSVIEKLTAEPALADVRAIGLTGQMHGATCIDNNNKPLRPAILWNDGRSYEECDILNKHPTDFKAVNGNTVMPGFTAPKLLWLKKQEPEVFKNIYKVLLPKDYIRLKLSGDYASDLSDASGTAWLDVGKRAWSEQLLTATDLTIEHMPKVYEGTEITGELKADLAHKWGMINKVKIIAGAGDNAAGAISLGITEPDRAMLSLGTSGVYFVPCTKFTPDPTKGFHTFCHCVPNKWHQMGVILSAASCLDWWRKITNMDEEQLITEAEHNTLKNVPLFLPYLSGERTPHNNPFAQGVFFGMTHNTNRPELTQAVLEGVAFAIANCQAVLKEVDTEVEQISVIGGGAKSKYWGQIMADVLNKLLAYHNESLLGPAFGAARLAMQENINIPEVTKIIYPNTEKIDNYVIKLKKYCKIYQQLRQLF
jgi:xylulokinase